MTPLRLALIGCGKVTERLHLPVAVACPEVEVSALFDPDMGRAKELASGLDGAQILGSLDEVGQAADAAIVAAPHHLHADIACTLLQRGVPVLVEKPMALDVVSCDRMLEAAEAGRATLAVGLVRRWYEASSWIKASIEAGDLGAVLSVDAREGAVFGWQVVSDATFRRDKGGGVLSDIGIHVLDLLAWWLGDPEPIAYRDDAMGGVDANCEIELRFPGGAKGFVELSRTRVLRNTTVIRCERGSLTIGPGVNPEIELEHAGRPSVIGGHARMAGSVASSRLETYFEVQLHDFVDAIRTGRSPFIDGREGRRSISLLEACSRVRMPLDLPWLQPGTSSVTDGVTSA